MQIIYPYIMWLWSSIFLLSSNFLYQNINVSTTFELNEISIDSSFKQQFYKITPEKSGITHFFSNSSEEVRKILLKLKSNKFYEFSEIFRRIEKNAIDVLSLKMRIDLNINQQLKDYYQKHREFDIESNEFLQNIHYFIQISQKKSKIMSLC